MTAYAYNPNSPEEKQKDHKFKATWVTQQDPVSKQTKYGQRKKATKE